MNYSAAVQFLYDLQLFGTTFGLSNTLQLARLAGDPQERLRFIHVAGTNGKGSTCAMLESIYRAAGRKTGLYTSPHLTSFRERIQVNRELIREDEVVHLATVMEERLRNFPKENHPTFFEVVTVMALEHFAAHQCDIVIWETGLGGRLDATNIVRPLASVITNVQLDHEKWLGNSVGEIAVEKVGIIKQGVPILTATDDAEVMEVIQRTATSLNAPLRTVTLDGGGKIPELGLAGIHQATNAALAIAVVETLQDVIPVQKNAVASGLKTVSWPGRLQLIQRGSQQILVDGAHNPAGVTSLIKAWPLFFKEQRPAVIFGVLADKDWRTMLQQLEEATDCLILCPVQSVRGADPDKLLQAVGKPNGTTIQVAKDFQGALNLCSSFREVVVTGSLHFVGEVLNTLQESGDVGERALNEWR